MREYLNLLDSWLNENSNKIRYGNPLTEEDIKQFEADNKCLLPEDLHELYCWNNGIEIDDKFQFLSLKEAHLFWEDLENRGNTINKTSGFWLPIFVSRTASANNYYVLWLSEVNKENADWILIENKAFPQPFYFKLGKGNDGQILNFYANLPALLVDSLHKLNPPKTTFWQEIKNIFNLVGGSFERW